jgi:hypothetical protein
MTCEADNSLHVDAFTMNDQGERQIDVRVYVPNAELAWLRRIPARRFKDGTAARASLPVG